MHWHSSRGVSDLKVLLDEDRQFMKSFMQLVERKADRLQRYHPALLDFVQTSRVQRDDVDSHQYRCR